MPPKRNREWDLAEVATRQEGVVSLDQLRETGVSARAAARRAERGGLHRVHRGVYASGHRSLSRIALLRAAVLACGEGAIVSHLTAAAHWGLQDGWPALIDVTVPVEAGRKIDGVRCRRCRYPAPEETVEHRGLLCTTPERTIVDCAGMLGIPALRKIVGRAAIRKRLNLERMDAAMERGFQTDRWRDQLLVAAGYRVIRVTWMQLDSELEPLVARIARALRHHPPVPY